MPLTFAGRLSTALASVLQLLPELAVAAAPVEPIASFQTEKEAQELPKAGWLSGSICQARFTTIGVSRITGPQRPELMSIATKQGGPGMKATRNSQ